MMKTAGGTQRRASQLTNTASELFVASQLSRMNCAVTISFGNTKVIDLMVAHPDFENPITIDVKGLLNTTNWVLKPNRISKTHFYVLVSYKNKFGDLSVNPVTFVIPSTEIKKVLSHWTGLPEVTCVGYKDVKDSKYKEAWSLLFKGQKKHSKSR